MENMNIQNQQVQEYMNEEYSGAKITRDIDEYVQACPYGEGKRLNEDGLFMVELSWVPYPDENAGSGQVLITGMTFRAGETLTDIQIFAKVSDGKVFGEGEPNEDYVWTEQNVLCAERYIWGFTEE